MERHNSDRGQSVSKLVLNLAAILQRCHVYPYSCPIFILYTAMLFLEFVTCFADVGEKSAGVSKKKSFSSFSFNVYRYLLLEKQIYVC
jgi:hypothetical protein